jgi:NAD(P)-dependent dehydrogenase (short-subunit alcohol dehydrogenase family)
MARRPNSKGSTVSFIIAGGTGTVGSKMTRELLAQGQQVRVLTRDAARAAEHLGDHSGLECDRRVGVGARRLRPQKHGDPRAMTVTDFSGRSIRTFPTNIINAGSRSDHGL